MMICTGWWQTSARWYIVSICWQGDTLTPYASKFLLWIGRRNNIVCRGGIFKRKSLRIKERKPANEQEKSKKPRSRPKLSFYRSTWLSIYISIYLFLKLLNNLPGGARWLERGETGGPAGALLLSGGADPHPPHRPPANRGRVQPLPRGSEVRGRDR